MVNHDRNQRQVTHECIDCRSTVSFRLLSVGSSLAFSKPLFQPVVCLPCWIRTPCSSCFAYIDDSFFSVWMLACLICQCAHASAEPVVCMSDCLTVYVSMFVCTYTLVEPSLYSSTIVEPACSLRSCLCMQVCMFAQLFAQVCLFLCLPDWPVSLCVCPSCLSCSSDVMFVW